MGIFGSLLRGFGMPFRRELLSICRSVAPHGSSLWIVENGVRFQFYRGTEVWVSLKDRQTGETTEIWDSDRGFRTPDLTLRRWFDEGFQLLMISFETQRLARERIERERIEALVSQYPSRYEDHDA